MRNVIYTALVAVSLIASACVHAQAAPSNLCPSGTKGVEIIEKGSDPRFPVSFPPDVGAYGETPYQQWDLSGATDKLFQVGCNPDIEGFSRVTFHDIPQGAKTCTFTNASGKMNCQK